MTQAPSIKEALEFYADPFAWKKKNDPENVVFVPDHYEVSGFGDTAESALATLQPSGDRREAIARIIHPNGFDSAGIEFEHAAEVEEAFRKADTILASGLVQDEAGEKVTLLLRMIDAAGGEIDATENVHSLLNYFCDDRGNATDTYNLAIDQGLIGSSFDSMFETSRAWLTDAGRAALAQSVEKK